MERLLKSRYKIGEKISENHFSVTYLGAALDKDKPVVIKIYKRGTLNSRLINRMKQKVRELSSLTHHSLAKLIDGDYGWQGFYYVREYVEGQSLKQLIEKKETIGVEQARDLALEVCRALELVHERGIVHGALKPSNVFITAKGLVKVADFVIEGEIKEAMPQKILALIDDGAYTSPEELAGWSASAASDIYALGLVLAEMALLQMPLLPAGLSGGLKRLYSSEFLTNQHFTVLPRYFQEIIKKCLQVDPQLRFRSVVELGESLENKNLVEVKHPHEEYLTLFENTVTQYGGEEISQEHESLEDLGRIRLRWGKEKHRNWILLAVLALAIISGLAYAFLFVR